MKRYCECIELLEKIHEKTGHYYSFAFYLHAKMMICKWSHFHEDLEKLKSIIHGKIEKIYPFFLLSKIDDPNLQKNTAIFFNKNSNSSHRKSISPPLNSGGKIKVAYFSSDFKDHPISYLMAEVFELHNRDQFFIIGISLFKNKESDIGKRIASGFDLLVDGFNFSDESIASIARDIGVDIAVDLNGFTGKERSGLFYYGAAPIQVSYLGYLGSMGATCYDYIIADKITIPNEHQSYYSEKIVYLESYQANDSKRTQAANLFSRPDLGLSDNDFVFCSFNHVYKFNPTVFDVWMNILKGTKSSVLFLYSDNEIAIANLKHEAELRNVNPCRLIFGNRLDREEYFARYLCCDLFLDTFPYNAGTTASDALWSGLPVLTFMGNSFPSRQCASLLTAIQLPELITHSIAEYEATAIELATDSDKLHLIKSKLKANKFQTPLFDSKRFTQKLENAYIQMFSRHQNGLKPDHIVAK
jgi:predicted O-linked N-acetylglucosamine transferase (SPINDLY family)